MRKAMYYDSDLLRATGIRLMALRRWMRYEGTNRFIFAFNMIASSYQGMLLVVS